MSRLHALLTALFVAFSVCGHCAAQAIPNAYPQWMKTFSREYLVLDRIANSPDPTWIRLSGGDAVTVTTVGYGLLLRRYGADGGLQRTHVERIENIRDILVRSDPTTDAIYVTAGVSPGTGALMRFDGELHRLWSRDLPFDGATDGSYLGLEVLSDGSAVALYGFRLARMGQDGQEQWVVADVGGGRRFLASASEKSGDDTIWVAAHSAFDGAEGTQTAVIRFDAAGMRLSADYDACANCYGSRAIGLDVLADGGAAVVGAHGQRSFFARYDNFGKRLLWTVSADGLGGYSRVGHDGSGAIYVLGTDIPDNQSSLGRVDAATGALLWTAPAADFTPRDSGVVAIRSSYRSGTSASGIVAVALDDAGRTLWSSVLSASNSADFSRGAYVAGNLELLLQENADSASCNRLSSHRVSLSAAGVATAMPPGCAATTGPAFVEGIDALEGVGVLANLGYRLAAYSPNGDLHWQATRCELCAHGIGFTLWGPAILNSDGGAWAIEGVRQTAGTTSTLLRLGASGETLATIPIAAAGNYPGGVLLGSDDGIVVLLPIGAFSNRILWQRAGNDGQLLETREYPIPDDDFSIDSTRRLADGGVGVVAKGAVICSVGCNPHYVTILNLAADGTLRWRYQFPESDAAVVLNDDGSAVAVLYPRDDGSPRLRYIDALGEVTPDILLTGITPWTNPQKVLPGPMGSHLLFVDGGFTWHEELWRLDVDGNSIAMRPADSFFGWTLAPNPSGYLAAGAANNAELLASDTLATRAYFRVFPSSSGEGTGPWTWRALDDGSVYSVFFRELPSGSYQMGVARFSVPGSSAADLLFRDGFN